MKALASSCALINSGDSVTAMMTWFFRSVVFFVFGGVMIEGESGMIRKRKLLVGSFGPRQRGKAELH